MTVEELVVRLQDIILKGKGDYRIVYDGNDYDYFEIHSLSIEEDKVRIL